MTGYAVGLPRHTARDGGIVWYGGGKLAADLSLPKLRRRWAVPAAEHGTLPGHGLPAAVARAVLRDAVTAAAEGAGDEAGFFARLGEAGVLVRLRFSETSPGQVTGYAVALPGHDGGNGEPVWHGGGRLAAGLTLPRLRRRWDPGGAAERGSTAERSGAFRCTVPERNAIYEHAARQAAAAAISLYEAVPVRARSYGCAALARVQLARAQLMSSNLEDAAEALAGVLALDPQRRISSLNQHLEACRELLHLPAYRSSSSARELDHHLAAFSAASTARALPGRQ